MDVVIILKFLLASTIILNSWTTTIGIVIPVEEPQTSEVVTFPFSFWDLPENIQPIAQSLLDAQASHMYSITLTSPEFSHKYAQSIYWTWFYALEQLLATKYYPRCTYLEQRYDTYNVNRPKVLSVDYQVGNTVAFRFNYPSQSTIESVETKAESYIHKFEQYLDGVMNELTSQYPEPNSKELFKAIYRYVVNSMEYDYDYLHTTLWDCIQAKRGVCNDYAKFLKVLCDRAGIPCHYVTGFFNDDPDRYHALNRVYLDGQWRWTDPTRSNDFENYGTYWYFVELSNFEVEYVDWKFMNE